MSRPHVCFIVLCLSIEFNNPGRTPGLFLDQRFRLLGVHVPQMGDLRAGLRIRLVFPVLPAIDGHVIRLQQKRQHPLIDFQALADPFESISGNPKASSSFRRGALLLFNK